MAEAAKLDDLAARTLEIVGIVSEETAAAGLRPVVVGGMAVYFWTATDAFLTNDIDVVVPTEGAFTQALTTLGFERTRDRRHWVLPGTEVLIEAPSSTLDDDAIVDIVTSPSGREVGVLSRVDVLLTRLDEFQATGHRYVAEQVLVLLAGLEDGDLAAAVERAPGRRLSAALDGLRLLETEIHTGKRTPPATDEWHQIANAFLRAEYDRADP